MGYVRKLEQKSMWHFFWRNSWNYVGEGQKGRYSGAQHLKIKPSVKGGQGKHLVSLLISLPQRQVESSNRKKRGKLKGLKWTIGKYQCEGSIGKGSCFHVDWKAEVLFGPSGGPGNWLSNKWGATRWGTENILSGRSCLTIPNINIGCFHSWCVCLKMHCSCSRSVLKIWWLQLSWLLYHPPLSHMPELTPYYLLSCTVGPQPSSSHPPYWLQLPDNWDTTQGKDLAVTCKDMLLEAEALMSSVEGVCWERHQQRGRRAKGERCI